MVLPEVIIDIIVGSLIAMVASYIIFPKAGVDNHHGFNHKVFHCMANYLKPFYKQEPDQFDQEKVQSMFDHMIHLFDKNTQIKNNLLFQTDRYTKSFAIYKKLYTLQNNLLLDITSFSWRYYHINQSYYADPLARDFINQLIYNISVEMDKLSEWCQQLMNANNDKLVDFKTESLNTLYIDSEVFIEKTFLRVDNNQMNVAYLVDVLALLRALQNILKRLQSVHFISIS